MDDVDEILKLSGHLFGKRSSLMQYWQDVAEQFYPERADFTTEHVLGDDFADHLTTSYPILARRDLGDTLSSMLRPKDRDWFYLDLDREVEDQDAKAWLQWASGQQRRAMYDTASHFVRATKQTDHDYAAFGQGVISVELNRARNGFLYRNWHLRDVAWRENAESAIDTIFRKWKPTASDLVALFPKTAHREVHNAIKQREPYREFECLHAVMPSDGKFRQAYRSVYIDVTNRHIMEDVGSHSKIYVIPRWQTVSGSQYAHSPATVAAHPEARLLQAVTLTLLEAGEMFTGPPMIAVRDAIRGDIDLRSRGITWVDQAYDERLGEVLRPLSQDSRGYPIGADIREEARNMIADAFYLNKLSLPPAGGAMTATEVMQRVQEYIRTTLPLFEPIEDDYNGAICEDTFSLGMRAGLFGPLDAIPESLQGADVQFRFNSPLSEAREREKVGRFVETKNLLLEAAQLDPSAAMMLNVDVAIRDALDGAGTMAKWLRSTDEMDAIRQQQVDQQQTAQQMQQVDQAAMTAQNVGAAADALGAVAA